MANTLEKIATLLQQLQIDILSNQNKFETCRKLAQLALLVEEVKREKKPEKHKNDIPNSTHYTLTTSLTLAPKGTERKKKKGKIMNSLVLLQYLIVEVLTTLKFKKTLKKKKGQNIIIRKLNYIKLGDINIRITQISFKIPKY